MSTRPLILLLAFVTLGCEPGAAIGVACTRAAECGSPLVCRLGRCRAECRAQRDCPVGALCLVDADGTGSCALPDDPDCRTAGCAGDLACVGSVCVNLCSSILECPAGSACVPTTDGRARCARSDGDAGTPGDAEPDAGVCLPGACDPIAQLAAGDGFTCVRTESHALWCWGAADSVARGPVPAGCTATACVTPAPVLVEGPGGDVHPATDVTWLSAREYGACIVATDEPVLCWANTGSAAALGNDGDGRYARAAVSAGGRELTGAVETHVMVQAVLARRGDATWAAWGRDDVGQFGGATTTGSHARAVEVGAPRAGATVVRVGNRHGCAIDAGEVWCWGGNDFGQTGDVLGLGEGATVLGAIQVAGVHGAIELALGDEHTCALLGTGDVMCWGERGVMGTASSPSGCVTSTTYEGCPPTMVDRGTVPFRHLFESGHASVTCAIDEDGVPFCWGHDWAGSRQAPVRVDLPGVVTFGVVTWNHICAAAGGEIYCWGENDWGQLGRDTGGAADLLPAPVVW